MPHKFNANRREKIPKQKHRVTNWADYNEGLRQRGDLTVWISEDALALWAAPRRATRGGQPRYSDLAIKLCLTLGLVFKQALRQTQGLMRSIARLLNVEITVPDFSTLSRRGNGLILQKRPPVGRKAAIHLTVDSTGLKIFGEGEWLEEKHKNKVKRKSWRKLHLGLDLLSGEIVCSDLTADDVGDPTALPDLLDQIDGPVTLFLAPSHGLLCNPLSGNRRRLRWQSNRRSSCRTLRVDDRGHGPASQERYPEPRRSLEPDRSRLPYCRHTITRAHGLAEGLWLATISEAASRHKWVAGRLLSDPS